MAIRISRDGTFKLVYRLRRVGTPGDAIAGVSLTRNGGANWHDLIWIRLINPPIGVIHKLTLSGLRLNDSSDTKPMIWETGTYGGKGSAWNGYSGIILRLWSTGEFPNGTKYEVYRAGQGNLTDRQNTIIKNGELVVLP